MEFGKRFLIIVILAAALGIIANVTINSPAVRYKEMFMSATTAATTTSTPSQHHQEQQGVPDTTETLTTMKKISEVATATPDEPPASPETDTGAGKLQEEEDHPAGGSRSSKAHAKRDDGGAKKDRTGEDDAKEAFSKEWELGWHQSDRMESDVDAILKECKSGLNGLVTKMSAAAAGGEGASGKTCSAYVSESKKLKKFDYTHRKKRKGELSNHEMYSAVRSGSKELGGSFLKVGPSLPGVINQYPPVFESKIDISKPFGSWKTAFFPLPEDGNETSVASWKKSEFQKFISPQKVPPQPPAYVGLFPKSVISSGHLIACDGSTFTSGGCLWDFRRPKSYEEVTEVPVGVALCDEWCKGFYHFTHEHLPRVVLVYDLLIARNDTFLVLSHHPNTFQLQFFVDILKIPRDRIISGKATKAQIGVYPMPMRCGNTFTHVLYMIRQLVWEKTGLSGWKENGRPKAMVLFAERRKLSRMPTNYHELKDRLVKEFAAQCEFSTTAGETAAKHQVGLFHDADVVIGPHGANIANMMWMRHRTHVIELASAKKGNMCYYTTASRVNISHQLLLHDQGKDSKYVVEYSELRAHVVFALKAVKKAFELQYDV